MDELVDSYLLIALLQVQQTVGKQDFLLIS